MRRKQTLKALMCASPLAIGVALAAAPASAQQNLSEAERADLTQACLELLDNANFAPGSRDGLAEGDAQRIARENVDAECVVAVRLIRDSASDADREEMDRMAAEREMERSASAEREIERSETMTETLQVEQEAQIEGEVAVDVPSPQVEVDQPAATVQVEPGRVEGRLDHGGGEIVVRQAQPNITVDMPAPTIRIEMPAPQVFVRLADPELQLDQGSPRVEVRQDEPSVTVRQREPDLDVDLDVDTQADADADRNDDTREEGVRRTTSADGNVTVTRRDAMVELRETDAEPQITMQRTEPNVSFEQAEPMVNFNMAEANVEFMRSGEVEVTYETAEEREARHQEEAATQAQSAENRERSTDSAEMAEAEDPLRSLSAPAPQGESVEMVAMTGNDLEDYDLYNTNGDNLGDAERLARHRGDLVLIVSHGGFLGIGDKEIALPLNRVMLRRERLIVSGLTDAQIDDMQGVDVSTLDVISMDEPIEINRMR